MRRSTDHDPSAKDPHHPRAPLPIGGNAPIAMQSIAATRTQKHAGPDLVRITVDSKADVEVLRTIRARTRASRSIG